MDNKVLMEAVENVVVNGLGYKSTQDFIELHDLQGMQELNDLDDQILAEKVMEDWLEAWNGCGAEQAEHLRKLTDDQISCIMLDIVDIVAEGICEHTCRNK